MDTVDLSQHWREEEEAEMLRRARLDTGIPAYLFVDCHIIIPEERRNAIPSVKRCFRCQTAYELEGMET